ncbi:P-loop NTPase family protein [Paenibacillus sp. strain BS8-2]
MHKRQLAVVARDKEYVKRLAGYIRESVFAESWQLTAFTSANSCKHYLKQGYELDILVAEHDLATELRDYLPHTPVAVLTERPGSGAELELLRYQSLPLFMGALEAICRSGTSLTNRDAEGVIRSNLQGRIQQLEGSTVLAVHSAAGGIGKTTLALHVAAAASVVGLRTCYVNVERWVEAGEWEVDADRESSVSGLSDLLYRIKAEIPWNSEQLTNCRRYSPLLKCDYIPGFVNPDDRLKLSGEDAVALVDQVINIGRYDLVVMDMDSDWSAMELALLQRAELVYELVRNEKSVIHKQRQAMQYALQNHQVLYKRVLERTHIICNGGYSGIDGSIFADERGCHDTPLMLPEVSEWRSFGCKPLTSSTYWAAVCELLKESMKRRGIERAAG